MRVLRLRRQRSHEENEICLLLGENPQGVPRGMDLDQEVVPDVGAGLPSSLLQRRPDVLEAEQELIAANADIGVAKADYFPNIGLTARGGRESTAMQRLFTGDAASWLLQPSLNIPIFAGGRIRAQVRQAEALTSLRLNTYVASVHQALRDVSDALAYREQAAAAVAAREITARDAAEVTRLSTQRSEAGVADELEDLSAEQSRLQAESDLATARFHRLDAAVQLYSALGGGWQDSAPHSGSSP
jgi:multidrug efflux system outer membrane protein